MSIGLFPSGRASGRTVCAATPFWRTAPAWDQDAGLAFTLTGLLLAAPAAVLPFITAGKLGEKQTGRVFTGVEGLWHNGMHLLAVWVLLCGAIVPAALLTVLAGLLLPARLGHPPLQGRLLARAARALSDWAMPEVQVLAVLVALMKLGNLVDLTIGPGFWCYCAMTLACLLAWRSFEFRRPSKIPRGRAPSPAAMKPRPPSLRSGASANAGALAAAAAAMLVPANLLPVLNTQVSGVSRTDTIFTGIVELWRQGLWAIALVVFLASMLIPVLKLAGLAWLLLATRGRARHDARRLTQIYLALDFIGRWSMLDVFLVGFLAGLVRFGALTTVEPRSGIAAFAIAVVLTILATKMFDPRVLWDDPAPPDAAASPS